MSILQVILIIGCVYITVLEAYTYPYNEPLVNNVFSNVSQPFNVKEFSKEVLKYLQNDLNMEDVFAELKKNVTKSSCLLSILQMNQQTIFKAIDSNFKPAPGLLTGNLQWLGNYRECMQTSGLHFCTLADVMVAQKLPLTLGFCIPEVCTSHDLVQVLQYVSKFSKFGNTSIIQVYNNTKMVGQYGADNMCYSKETKYNSGSVIMLTITGVIIFLCFCGTLTELIKDSITGSSSGTYKVFINTTEKDIEVENKAEELNQADDDGLKKSEEPISMHQVDISTKDPFMMSFLLCFSVIKNTKAILNTDVPKGSITALNGMRTISITWVILGHCLAFGISFVDDVLNVFTWIRRFSMQAIINASPSVDSFFFLSGLLVAYLSIKRYQSKGSLPLVRYYVHRYIRLTPSYAYLMFFLAYLYPLLGSGPMWYTQGPNSLQSENCITYWWTNLLYINNLYPEINNMCMNWSWYLANDMQFYVISPIILYCMYKFKWLGVSLTNGILLLACFIVNGVLIYHYKLSPLFVDPNANFADPASMRPTQEYMLKVYMKPYTRISPYLVGLVMGYILINKCSLAGKFEKLLYGVGWIVAIGLGIAVIYGPYSQNDYKWKMVDNLIYGMFFRFVWAVAIGWVIFACHNGKGGLVNSFLSWKAFIPLSRLTYATYLVHPMVIFFFYASTQATTDLTIAFYVYFFVASTVISFMLAFVVAVCIEYPVFNLEKLVLKF